MPLNVWLNVGIPTPTLLTNTVNMMKVDLCSLTLIPKALSDFQVSFRLSHTYKGESQKEWGVGPEMNMGRRKKALRSGLM